MDADERRQRLADRIGASLQQAESRGRWLARTHGRFVWAHFAVGALSTLLALLATLVGQAGFFHFFLPGQAPAASPEASNVNWKFICGLVTGLNALALFLGNAPRVLTLLDQLSRLSAGEGALRRLRASLDIFQHDPTDVEKEYLALISAYPEVDCSPVRLADPATPGKPFGPGRGR